MKEGELLLSACCIADQQYSRVMAVGKVLFLRLDVLANRVHRDCDQGEWGL